METELTATVDAPETGTTQATAADTTSGTPAQEKTFTQADLDRILKDRLAQAQSKAEKAAQAAAEAATRKAEEEQGQYQKLYDKTRAELETERAERKTVEMRMLRAEVARRVGLPDALAARLQGEDEESLTTDAKALLSLLPKPTAPNLNSGGGSGNAPAPGVMSDAEKRELAAIYGVNPKYI